mmetsp:Transcript_30311/g.56617  ORF Transcript_30311/g.56617 Transcript_30311/m.56617 type:complete len:112 (-) Transcript_30311:93-428(-)
MRPASVQDVPPENICLEVRGQQSAQELPLSVVPGNTAHRQASEALSVHNAHDRDAVNDDRSGRGDRRRIWGRDRIMTRQANEDQRSRMMIGVHTLRCSRCRLLHLGSIGER